MGLTVHLVKVGRADDIVRYVAPFSTSSDAYFGVARTRAELVDMIRTMGLEPDEEDEILVRGTAILEGRDPAEAEVIDMAAFSALYERLYSAAGFVGCPASDSASDGAASPTTDEIRILMTGIRFLREFYDEGEVGLGITGFRFVTI